MKIPNDQQGFSLVELLIGIAILAIIMAAVFGVLSASVKSHQYNFDAGANIQDTRVILNESSNQLRNAIAISAPNVNVHADSITFVTSLDPSHNRTIALGKDANAGYVLFTDSTGTRKLGSGRVASLDMVYSTVGAVSPFKRQIIIKITVKNPARSGAPLSDLTTSVVTLNSF